MSNGQQPVIILPEGTLRNMGKSAQLTNIAAAKAVAESVKSTLGPKGMDKMLVDSLGDIVITNDGVTILDEMHIEHPAGKMIVEVAKTQDEEVGDGTTSATILAGELLKKAEGLIEQNIHPTVITAGYRTAKKEALKILEDKIAKNIAIGDEGTLNWIAITAMTGKTAVKASTHLAKIAVEAVKLVRNDDGTIDTENIKVEKKQGSSIDDTELVRGVILDKDVVHSGMPKKIEMARIALIDSALEIEKPETDAQIRITSPEQMQQFLEQEEQMLKKMVEKISSSGANVVFCQKGIDDMAQHYLAKKGILAARRVKKSDLEKISKATGGNVVTSLDDLTASDLGDAGIVEEKKIAGEQMIFVRQCKNPKSVSVLVRGGTEHVVQEVERAIEDAIGGVASALEVGKVVAGGGSPEEAVSKGLREIAQRESGRAQLAILAFAEAMEAIPRTLAENAGLDPINMLVKLRAAHDKGETEAGIDVFKGEIVNMYKEGVIEPLKIKTQAIKSAAEVAEMILRIDDIISAGKLNKSEGGMQGMPPGMPPGMGGMPPGMM